MSIPSMVNLADLSMEQIVYDQLLIRMKDPDDTSTIDEIAKAFRDADSDYEV